MAENKFIMNKDTLTVTSKNISECIEYINKSEINSIYICRFYYEEENLDFLEKCQCVQEININNNQINNVDGLYKLNNLKHLILQDIDCKVDLSKMGQLEGFSGTWNKNYDNLDKQNKLKYLNLSNYKPKSKNMCELGVFSELETLELVRSTINSLNGIGQLSNIKSLRLYFCRNLNTIKELENSKKIKELMIEGCKKIEDYYSLEKVNLNKITIFDCGCIDSIRFIDSLDLSYFVCLKTKIIDDSFTPKKKIAYLELE